jgi:hypothetical protein
MAPRKKKRRRGLFRPTPLYVHHRHGGFTAIGVSPDPYLFTLVLANHMNGFVLDSHDVKVYRTHKKYLNRWATWIGNDREFAFSGSLSV